MQSNGFLLSVPNRWVGVWFGLGFGVPLMVPAKHYSYQRVGYSLVPDAKDSANSAKLLATKPSEGGRGHATPPPPPPPMPVDPV